ncbi:MAG: hypothetical protein KJ838_05375, partial [Candidatus Omnitrophica bacterium]|nr:hypothetical protein [Candidatus Omnitrophota bacterium]
MNTIFSWRIAAKLRVKPALVSGKNLAQKAHLLLRRGFVPSFLAGVFSLINNRLLRRGDGLSSSPRWKQAILSFCSTFRGWWGTVTAFLRGVAGGDRLEENLRGAATLNQAEFFGTEKKALSESDKESLQQERLRRIIGDYKVLETRDELPYDYVKYVIDIGNSPQAKEKLEEYFKANIETGDEYYILYFKGSAIALIKKDSQGKIHINKIVEDLENIPLDAIAENTEELKTRRIKTIDLVLEDYLFFEERAKISVPERMTLTYKELRQYQYEFAKEEQEYERRIEILKQRLQSENKNTESIRAELRAQEKGYEQLSKRNGLVLAGGKGLSLSLMDGVVDVPPGFNVTTTAYFKFVRDNPNVYEKIRQELRILDTMDDQRRDVVSREIREVMKVSLIPEDISREVLVMYRHLNIIRVLAGKKTPTAVAVRSSGIKEDIKVESWLPITTGSQAGQSDTYLNVKGRENVLDKLRADWASLFTDRAVSYRDDAIFLIFSSLMGFEGKQPNVVYYELLGKLREYAEKLRRPEFNSYADILTSFRNPGSVNLMNAMELILEQENDPQIRHCLEMMRQTAEEFVHPEQIGIDVVIMQMAKSYLSGVLFTVNPATAMAGVPQALYNSWYRSDRSLIYEDKSGNITGSKPIVVSFEISYGYGENVVGGKVDPDKFVMGTYDGFNWFIIEKHKGTKLIQMVDVEESIQLLQHNLAEQTMRILASMVGEAISYDEVGKRINGILATRLYGTRYLKELANNKDESDKDKKARLQKIAEEIAEMIKSGQSKAEVKGLIQERFYVVTLSGTFGINESVLDSLIEEVFDSVDKARAESEEGKSKLGEYFSSAESAQAFIMMIKEVWENKEFVLTQRQAVLEKLNLQDKELRNLSYLIRSLIDESFTCNFETTAAHQNSFSITDTEVVHIARLAWNITTYYQDQRDVEFAIEIDPSAPEGKRLFLHALDKDGFILMMTDKGELIKTEKNIDELREEGRVALRLYNVQARPYTSGYIKVDFVREGTEVDENFIEAQGYKPIANGTKGGNATHAYVLVFDTNKTIDWHAEQIRRLKRGEEFTDEERKQLIQLGFNPDDYVAGSDKQLPVALYLLEADPSHDPIMRLVNAVITIRGGDTCHAAIFCREQGIPAVTAVGKVILDEELLKTGQGLTIDANNGRLYKLEADPGKRIPINFVKFRIKPYGIPGDDDNSYFPSIGLIIAAVSAAQQNTPIMLAVDSAGNALTRAEFKGEELGVNVIAGYGYDLIQDIKAGKQSRPQRIYVDDLIERRVPGADRFIAELNAEIYKHFKNSAQLKADFQVIFGREYKADDSVKLLVVFDILNNIEKEDFDRDALSLNQGQLLAFIERIPKDSVNLLQYAYGLIQRRFNFDLNIIEALETHPWVIEEISDKLKEKGYFTFKDYAASEFYYFYNLMGFTIAVDQKAKNRAYDFAQDKVRGLIGSEIFSWPGANPLVGLRGSSLEIEGVDSEFEGNQKVLSFLLES